MGTTASVAADPARLRERAEALHWYHTMDLAPGVVTRGWFDTRPVVAKVPLPARLDGLRCLDVGTWDGFWAFELERRGAAEVVAIDLDDPERWDWPPLVHATGGDGPRVVGEMQRAGTSFRLAHEALGSRVDRRNLSVYELDPDRIGSFDVVFMGSLLLHLRDPVLALDRIRSVCRGELVLADVVEALGTLLRPRSPVVRFDGLDKPWWWQPNRAALHRMVRSAAFEIVEAGPMYFEPIGAGHPPVRLRRALRRVRTSEGRQELFAAWRGIPHAAVRARPMPGA